ncbi:MAG: hypothetical protein P8Y71_28945, partial [Pseudolabrys sp.]
PCATPSSRYSLDYRRSDARTVENGFATNGGLSKSAKVVLESLALADPSSEIAPDFPGPIERLSQTLKALTLISVELSHFWCATDRAQGPRERAA